MPPRAWILLVSVAVAALAGALLATWASRTLARARLAWRRRRGRAGERKAPAVLRAAGYRLLEQQAERALELAVDGEVRPYTVRADGIAERDGQRFVVEVKTGKKAPDPRHSATRRQLLEYRLVYDVDGVLLVDMEAERVHRITWPELTLPGRRRLGCNGLAGLGVGLVVGLSVGLILGWWVAS